MPQLVTARDFYNRDPLASVPEADRPITATPPPNLPLIAASLTARGTTSNTASVNAYVNEGRWVAGCPFCNSAQLTSVTDPRFLCANCANVSVQGAYLPVVFPAAETLAAIEKALVARPFAVNRNWTPDETVEQLVAENIAHRVMRP